jgi:hypothetical protein
MKILPCKNKKPHHTDSNPTLTLIHPGTDAFPTLSNEQLAEIDAIHPNPRVAPVHKVCPDPLPLK